jgi:hypothetical protein
VYENASMTPAAMPANTDLVTADATKTRKPTASPPVSAEKRLRPRAGSAGVNAATKGSASR